MGTGVRHIDKYKTELLLLASTGSAITAWLDLQYYSHCTFFVAMNNSATGTPAITCTAYEAQDISGTSSAVLSINTYFYCTGGFTSNQSSGDNWQQLSSGITGGSFATGSTHSTTLLYAIEIQDTDLPTIANSLFKTVALSFGAAASTTVTVWAHLFPRFDGNFADLPTALT
jgi:hypothetical protein